MALKKLLLIGIFVVSPIILEAQHNRYPYLPELLGYSSVHSKHPKDPEVIVSEPYYDSNNMENGKVISHYRAVDENRKRKELGSNIIFPDENILLTRNGDDSARYEVNLMPTCKEKNFCLNEPRYPTNFINQMLRNNPNLMNYATMDAVEIISHRIDSGDDQLCESRVHLINPKSAKNIEDDWMFIVQSEESHFKQSIRIEVCEKEDACQKIEGFALGYKTKCRQKFIYRQLMAISHEGELVNDLFPIPASCCCHLIKDEVYQTKRTISEKDRA